jgi:phosphoribosyl 1,2-cyclic phosphate phosphodiesterase
MSAELIILGCGSSAGVPAIGNWWGNCDPANPKNRRTRPSVAVQTDQTCVVVDTGPDFREQMNREKLRTPDAILFTHEHADHVAGIDELRTLQRLEKRIFPVFSDAYTLDRLKKRVDYMFKTTENGFYPAVCSENTLNFNEIWHFNDIKAHIFKQDHGTIDSLGFRVGSVAYSTDFKRLDDIAIDILRGVDVWIADSAGYESLTNPVHACIDEVIAYNERIGARQVYLTHMPPTMDYDAVAKRLPPGYAPAYDGLRIEIVT